MNAKTQGIQRIDTIRLLLEKMKPEIQKVLPKHLDPARIIRMALTDFQTVKHLNECTAESFLGALMECSQLGLEPGRIMGEAYLLPFKNKTGQYICKLIPGYRGLITIARRSGEIKAIYARAVFSNDDFDYCYGLEEYLTHKPAMGERGELTYVYAVAKLHSGETQFEVMDSAELEKIRARSRAADDGPWITDPIEMSKKSVLKRLCKNLPTSTELRTSIAMDNPDVDEPKDISNFVEETHSLPAPKPYALKSRLATPEEAEEIWAKDSVEEKSNVSSGSRSGFTEGIDSQNNESTSPAVLSEYDAQPVISSGNAVKAYHHKKEIESEKEKTEHQHSKSIPKDHKKKEEFIKLRMEIQDKLFNVSNTPEEVGEKLKQASLHTKCGQGYLFMTVQDLAESDNLAWLREIADELGRM